MTEAAPPLTAGDVVDRLLAATGVPARPTTVDGILDGDPATPVARAAVTTMATLDVLRGAVDVGARLVITHEPLYFDHADGARDALEAERDPVWAAKRAFVAEHGLVVAHLHDRWHDRRPDGVDAATADALGWRLDPAAAAEGLALATVEATTLEELARHVAARLGATALRFLGDPEAVVRRVGLDLGFRGAARNRALLRRPDVDVAVVGECHEWETGEYAADAVATGVAAGLVVVGHVPSEQAASAAVAALLRDAVPGLAVEVLATPDLFRAV